MRLIRTSFAAAAIGTILLGTSAANASNLPPTPTVGENPVAYACAVAHWADSGASCDDVLCGPKSCDIVGDRAR